VFGPLKERGESRRLDKHLPEEANLITACEFQGLNLRVPHFAHSTERRSSISMVEFRLP
jgi:hypothetical protein